MMRTIMIGIVLIAVTASDASLLTSAASNDALDAGLMGDTRTAAPPATPAAAAPAVLPPAAPAAQRSPSANPLWGIPLTQLSGTRDRPIFSASRRPVPVAVAAEPVVAKPAPPPKKQEPTPPPLALVGTIASGDQGFAIFMDRSGKTAIRLKIGEDYQDWKLRSIWGREATMEKDQQAAVLSLPQPSAAQASGAVRLQPANLVKLLHPIAEHFR
jgi:hypothetical protein